MSTFTEVSSGRLPLLRPGPSDNSAMKFDDDLRYMPELADAVGNELQASCRGCYPHRQPVRGASGCRHVGCRQGCCAREVAGGNTKLFQRSHRELDTGVVT